MQRVRPRQLELAFADNSPQGGRGPAAVSGVPEAKAWLRHRARPKAPEGLTAGVIPHEGGLLERVASWPVLAKALLNVSSHGFRPTRGAQTAIAEAKRYVAEGHNVVVDLDISKFFDHVNHQRLLARVGRQVQDGRVLKLIHGMLKAQVVMPEGTKVRVQEGTPQGGPLSPLLSNIVLDELDQELARRGLRFVRYADDGAPRRRGREATMAA